MKTSVKHLLFLSLAAVLSVAGLGCKKNREPIYYTGEWHYFNKVSNAPPYGPDTGGIITDTLIRLETLSITQLDTNSTGHLDSVEINGTKYTGGYWAAGSSPDHVSFYNHYDNIRMDIYLSYSGHSYSRTENIFYGHRIK